MAGSQLSELIRVRGLVQGVGFRPTVWRLARRHGLRGWVGNDGAGVAMAVSGTADDIAAFVTELRRAPPPLARIDTIERAPAAVDMEAGEFRIVESQAGEVRTGVVPDAATCAACRQEIFDRDARRFRYPFANCTQCGPRLSIIETIPYDRASTTMRAFRMCADCAAEYVDPADRRFHAQPVACPACGPRVWLQTALSLASSDPLSAAQDLMLAGEILAVKGLGGFHLACDATNQVAVERLRQAKRRDAKPFALMARDLCVIQHYVTVTDEDAAALQSPAAPIVLMQARSAVMLPGVAPGLATLGFMLPATPLHHLLLDGIDRPLVMTSGNLSDEPQCIGNEEALQRLSGITTHFLLHDRDIARRVDDSVVRVIGGSARVLRRARGCAPAPIPLPEGFGEAPPVLAMGGELKNTFCLLRDGQAILSHHMGDLENAPAFADYRRSIGQYSALFAHAPRAITVDRHPDYLSSKLGAELARRDALPVIGVQHHHAHLAACIVENAVGLNAGPVLGIVLDGLGWGEDGTIWGGEVLLGDYRGCRRMACLRPVPMPGGAQAIREPWRNAFAQIHAYVGWDWFVAAHGASDFGRYLLGKPIPALRSMIERGVNTPLTSSCGRLFDAVAAAVGLCRDRALYEGQAAMMLEAAAEAGDVEPYPFGITESGELMHLDPAPLWPALLDDLAAGVPAGAIAARFHAGLAAGIARLIPTRADEDSRPVMPAKAGTHARAHDIPGDCVDSRFRGNDEHTSPSTRSGIMQALGIGVPIALSGGVFQNRLLLEQVVQRLTAQGHQVLTHRVVPANDGGLALGQAAIAAARMLSGDEGG